MTNKKQQNLNSGAIAETFASWFGITKAEAQRYFDGNATLEELLNLSPSEDAVINHFIMPFLKNALGYTVGEIDIKPSLTINDGRQVKTVGGQSDVIVKKASSPVFVIEAKKYGHPLISSNENAEGQAFDYTRANELRPRPKYYLTTNVEETHIYETLTRLEVDFSPIKTTEIFDKFEKLYNLVSKKKVSPLGTRTNANIKPKIPITDQREFERILYKCQDEMREASEAKTGIIAFAEMNKLLFIKIHEDRREREGQDNSFTLQKIEAEGDNYIRGTLFANIKDYYRRKNIKIFRDEDKIDLDDITTNRIVERLEKIILVDEKGNVYPPVAHIYENFVSTIFRGENGQYFTPRNIVDFIVGLAQVKWDTSGKTIVDPACGSGGFLLSAFATMNNELKRKFMTNNAHGELVFKNANAERDYGEAKLKLCEKLLVGIDNEEIVAKTAAMNMSVHGDGSTGIHYGDSLKISFFDNIKTESFDMALTNPPFSSEVKIGSHIDSDSKDILEKYELGHIHKYSIQNSSFEWSMSKTALRSQDSKVLFIERCAMLLKEGGLLGIVVDDGVLNNPRDNYIRDFIYRNFIIKAVISLPYDIFKEQDAHNFTSILLLQKKRTGDVQGNIFMAIAEHCGETFGKSTMVMSNDLDIIREDYFKYISDSGQHLSKYSFICKADILEQFYDIPTGTLRNRIDPKFYHPRKRAYEKAIKETGHARPIGEVVTPDEEICPPEKVNSFGSYYIDSITKSGLLEIGTMTGVNDPKGAKDRVYRKGDLVASRINLKTGMITIIPKEIEEVRGTGEYYKIVPKIEDGKEIVSRKYLFIILTSEPLQYLMQARATGQFGRLSDEELAKIEIPVYDSDVQKKIISKYEQKVNKVSQMLQEAETKKRELIEELTDDLLKK